MSDQDTFKKFSEKCPWRPPYWSDSKNDCIVNVSCFLDNCAPFYWAKMMTLNTLKEDTDYSVNQVSADIISLRRI